MLGEGGNKNTAAVELRGKFFIVSAAAAWLVGAAAALLATNQPSFSGQLSAEYPWSVDVLVRR